MKYSNRSEEGRGGGNTFCKGWNAKRWFRRILKIYVWGSWRRVTMSSQLPKAGLIEGRHCIYNIPLYAVWEQSSDYSETREIRLQAV